MRYLLLLLAALVVASCNKGVSVVGKYRMQLAAPSGNNDAGAALANALGSMLTLELKADNTFTMAMVEGTYTVSGDTVELSTTKMTGQDVSKAPVQPGMSKTMQFRIEDGGKTLVPMEPNPKTGKPGDTKFVRE